jgi:hypothetical protein
LVLIELLVPDTILEEGPPKNHFSKVWLKCKTGSSITIEREYNLKGFQHFRTENQVQ